MKRRTLLWAGVAMLACWFTILLARQPAVAQEEADPARYFLYLSDKRIITAELLGSRRVIVNYINLDNVIEVLKATNLLLVDASGQGRSGHLFKSEQPLESGSFYFVSELIEPREFKGFEILGNFRLDGPVERVFFRVGARIVELEPLREDDFELVANKISELELTVQPKLALVDAGFWRGYGKLHRAGAPELQNLRGLFAEVDPVPPVLLRNPRPRLLQKFQSLPDPVVVSLRVNVNRLGGIEKSEVISAPDAELGEQALETVRNSWEFLPAISQGKPADAELVVQVVFDRPQQ